MALEFPSPEPMSDEMVRDEAHRLFWKYVNKVGEDRILQIGMDFDYIYNEFIYPKYEIELNCNIDLGFDHNGREILGQFLYNENVAIINKSLIVNNDPRRIFTTVHEVIGHGVLQGNYLRKMDKEFPPLFTIEEEMHSIDNTFEHQANTMATNFIAPEGLVRALYWKVFRTRRNINYIGPAKYNLYVHGMDCSVWAQSPNQLAWAIAKRLRHYFWGLSTESLMYRVLRTVINCNGFDNEDFGYPDAIYSIGGVMH